MEHAQAQRTEAQNINAWPQEHKRLEQRVRIMALEIERLNEETKQLRAAVSMYREIARRIEAARFMQRQEARTDAFRMEQITGLDHALPVMGRVIK